MSQNEKVILLKFKKAQGQLNKVVQMYENGDYCIDVIQQNLATIGILKSAQQELINHHLRYCFKEAANNERKQQKMTEELIKVLNYYWK